MSEPLTSNTVPLPETMPSPRWWPLRRISLRYKRRARQRMKAAAEHALDALDKTLEIAGGAAGDTGVPGLAGALSAVRVVLQKIQAMKMNAEGVDSLAANVVSLRTIVEEFVKHRGEGQQISKDTLDQIAELEKTWSEIAQKATDIRSRGKISRFFASNADTKKLEGFVEEISTSIRERFILRSILNIKEDAHAVRRNVEVVREDVRAVQEGVKVVIEGVEMIDEDIQAVRSDVEVVHEGVEEIREHVEVVRENTKVIRDDVEVVREDIGMVRADVENFREDVEVVLDGVQVVLDRTEVVREGVGTIRQDANAIREGVGAVLENVGEMSQNVNTILEGSFMTTYAKNAQYNAGGAARRSCLEGTRVSVLNRLYAWINAACTRTAEIVEAASVFWINGLAGTGKTTIAVSVAEWCLKHNLLAANFFCSRSDAECSNPSLIFPTLSRQLCHFHAPFKEKVAAILQANPDVVHAIPSCQFEELIVRPLEAVKDSFPTSVIVLDALDECLDKEATSIILTAISKFISRIAGIVLFVVTSRPERRINTLFEPAERNTLKDVTTLLLLHKIELESVLDDIRRFLEDGFSQGSRIFTVSEGWPTTQDINELAEMSGGLFIWAATALLFVMDMDSCDPEGQLQLLLTALPKARPGETDLNLLYEQIAGAVFLKASPTLISRLRPILGAIALAQEPLSVSTLATLVNINEDAVRNALTGLGSVLHIPSNSTETIHIIHHTFPEFLLASSPTKPEAFRISVTDHHLALFTQCMVTMRDLRRNISHITNPSAFKSEIPGLAKIVEECIPSPLRYACRYWSSHFTECVGSRSTSNSFDVFHEFLHYHYLHWLEACSLLGVIENAVNALGTVLYACQTLGGRFADLIPLLVVCRRLALTYAACVDASPLQVYHSVLPLTPTKSLVRKTYTQELGSSLIICRGARSNWAPCLDVIKGHSNETVLAVVFSPSGGYFVTGGADKKLRMWGPATRMVIRTFEGHKGYVNCVAFSPNGVYVASGSNDQDVRVWQVSTGGCVQMLVGHTGPVSSVAYSATGHRVLSATFEGEIKLWDMSDGRCILIFDPTHRTLQPTISPLGGVIAQSEILDPTNHTLQVGISPFGGVIAHGEDAFVRLFYVFSGKSKTLSFPRAHKARATTFSPDGRYIAARSSSIIRVWKCDDKSLVGSIGIPDSGDSLVGRLAFSRDSTHICCGSSYGSVYIWNFASEALPFVLRGHTGAVWDLSWSPDGLQLVSVSSDGTIRVWDVTQPSTQPEDVVSQHRPTITGPVRFALVHHKHAIILLHLPSVSVDIAHFSALASLLPEGAPTIKLFADMADAWDAVLQVPWDPSRVIRDCVWAAVSGQQHVRFSTQLVTVSPDGSLMAYLSPTSNHVVDVFDLLVGRVVASLCGHTCEIFSLAFSPDSTLIVTGSVDKSVKVWNSSDGIMACSRKEHTGLISVLTFSSSGRLIASGSVDATVHVFEADTGRTLRVFESHRDRVTEVAFTANDAHIMTLDRSNRLYIWDMASGVCIYDTSTKDYSWIHALNFSSDGIAVTAGGGHPEAPAVSVRRPGSRTWPVYAVSKEGWLYAKSPGRTVRLGWLPPEWREVFSLGDGKFCAPDVGQRRAVVFDASQLPDFMHT